MCNHFQKIGLFTKASKSHNITDSINTVVKLLAERGHDLIFEEKAFELAPEATNASFLKSAPKTTIGKECDLAIVIGGDGSLLHAARHIVDHHLPIVGINRGQLGFLADIRPDEIETKLNEILSGNYQEDRRVLLHASIKRNNKIAAEFIALNDIVLYHGSIARLIEFEVFIDNHFVMYQRADGLIAATPTGSTAYALSGGGPIVYPSINAITLVPMFPHTLSSRPIVINDTSTIKLLLSTKNSACPKLSADGQEHCSIKPGDEITIKKYQQTLRLIHPQSHNYYAMLREKLGWYVTPQSKR